MLSVRRGGGAMNRFTWLRRRREATDRPPLRTALGLTWARPRRTRCVAVTRRGVLRCSVLFLPICFFSGGSDLEHTLLVLFHTRFGGGALGVFVLVFHYDSFRYYHNIWQSYWAYEGTIKPNISSGIEGGICDSGRRWMWGVRCNVTV